MSNEYKPVKRTLEGVVKIDNVTPIEEQRELVEKILERKDISDDDIRYYYGFYQYIGC